MKIRAWANDDPKSIEMVTYTIPPGILLPWDVEDRVNDYNLARVKHVEQLSDEVVEWKNICQQNGFYKDIFEYTRDKYIFRPVERAKKEKEKIPYEWIQIVPRIFFMIGAIVCMHQSTMESILTALIFVSVVIVKGEENFNKREILLSVFVFLCSMLYLLKAIMRIAEETPQETSTCPTGPIGSRGQMGHVGPPGQLVHQEFV